jgi:hypothetical protein
VASPKARKRRCHQFSVISNQETSKPDHADFLMLTADAGAWFPVTLVILSEHRAHSAAFGAARCELKDLLFVADPPSPAVEKGGSSKFFHISQMCFAAC